MEIVVQGRASDFITPDLIILDINFVTNGYSYEEVLREGVKNVQLFVDDVLLKNGFTKEDMKTRNFVIKENTKYNKVTGEYENDRYSYNQKAILKFDYDKEKLASMMIMISKMNSDLMYSINFGIKNEKDIRKNILAIAYNDALEQAQVIANAAFKTLKYCQKVDFKPFTANCISGSSFDSNMMCMEKAYAGAQQAIINTFTPEDVEISEVLYCLFIAE